MDRDACIQVGAANDDSTTDKVGRYDTYVGERLVGRVEANLHG